MPTPPTPPLVRAISIRQPYAELILLGKKTIEYRSRKTNLRERVYIYASLTLADDEAFRKAGLRPDSLLTGLIIGSVEITDCTGEDGDYEWHLANPKRLDKPLTPKNQPQPGIWRPQF